MLALPWPKAVLFDWDGTLVSSFSAIVRAVNETLVYHRAPALHQDEAIRTMQIGTARAIFGHLLPDDVDSALEYYYARVPQYRLDAVEIIHGARTCLDLFRAADVPMGIVSNMRHTLLKDEVAHLGLDFYFGGIVGAGETPLGKPDPAPVYLCLERMGLTVDDAPDCWFVGDMAPDQMAAQATGCSFLYYTGSHGAGASDLAADHIFSDYDQFNNDFSIYMKNIGISFLNSDHN